VTLPELARDLGVPEHQVFLLAAQLLRVAHTIFADQQGNLTELAEYAIREHVEGIRRAVSR
jgi:hypothetical protein